MEKGRPAWERGFRGLVFWGFRGLLWGFRGVFWGVLGFAWGFRVFKCF